MRGAPETIQSKLIRVPERKSVLIELEDIQFLQVFNESSFSNTDCS
jgi:hypothetical protein